MSTGKLLLTCVGELAMRTKPPQLGEYITRRKQFEAVGEGLLVRAPAKINLCLLVAGKRPDGFHNIETVMAKTTWYDDILVEPGDTWEANKVV